MSETSSKICIIGAGPGGLCAAVAFTRQGIPFDIYDAGNRVGGIWDIEREDTAMYESAHFISSKTKSGFLDFPMPDDYPDYPDHRRIRSYLEAYAQKHDLIPHIRFGKKVEALTPQKGGKAWEVRLDSGESAVYRGVCCATGVVWHPNPAEYPGTFEGESMHAFTYKHPDTFRGKKVLIIGAGNSGVDIACDAAINAETAFISLRRGYYFVPKYIFGKPADVFASTGPKLPAWIEIPIYEFLINNIIVGDLRKYGLRKPDHHVLESHPIMNTQILHHLGHGDIAARPDVKELKAHSVVFEDGSEEEVDLIVYATGYQRVFPFMGEKELPMRDGKPDLYLHLFHRKYDNLFFMGLPEIAGAAFELFGRQAELIADFIQAQDQAPAKAAAFAQLKQSEYPDLRGAQHYIDTPRHDFYVQWDRYLAKLKQVSKKVFS